MAVVATLGHRGELGAASLQVEIARLDARAVISCTGHLAWGSELGRLLDAGSGELSRGRDVVVDLGGVASVDAGGLGAIARLWDVARAAGRSVTIVRARPRVRRLLEVAFGRSITIEAGAAVAVDTASFCVGPDYLAQDAGGVRRLTTWRDGRTNP